MTNLELSGSRIPDVCSVKLTFLLTATCYLTITENRNKKLTKKYSSHTVALNKGTIFAKKCWFFAKKMLTWAKLRKPWYQKVYFLKLYVSVYLSTKFQVSSIILTSFRQGRVNFTPPSSKRTPKTPTQIRVNSRINTHFLSLGFP